MVKKKKYYKLGTFYLYLYTILLLFSGNVLCVICIANENEYANTIQVSSPTTSPSPLSLFPIFHLLLQSRFHPLSFFSFPFPFSPFSPFLLPPPLISHLPIQLSLIFLIFHLLPSLPSFSSPTLSPPPPHPSSPSFLPLPLLIIF